MHFGLMRELSVGQKFQGVVISYASGSHLEGRIHADGGVKTQCEKIGLCGR